MRRFLAGVLVGILLSVGTGLTAFLLLGSWLAVVACGLTDTV